jgi:hypothetical protein
MGYVPVSMTAPEPSYLETYMMPVCRFEEAAGTALIRAFHGTAFFINDSGVFLTARHVVENGQKDINAKGGFLGLCVRPPGPGGNVACPIGSVDYADMPYDVCVGRAAGKFRTMLTLANVQVHAWRDVATYGYPETALNVSPTEFWMYGRGFRGYVHREVKKGHLLGTDHPDAFETSFSMPPGLSGAPLFIHQLPRDVVVGICVGVNRGESTEFLLEEVVENGEVRREKRVRIEEYGLAHDLRPLLDWQPAGFGGLTLLAISAQMEGAA